MKVNLFFFESTLFLKFHEWNKLFFLFYGYYILVKFAKSNLRANDVTCGLEMIYKIQSSKIDIANKENSSNGDFH